MLQEGKDDGGEVHRATLHRSSVLAPLCVRLADRHHLLCCDVQEFGYRRVCLEGGRRWGVIVYDHDCSVNMELSLIADAYSD